MVEKAPPTEGSAGGGRVSPEECSLLQTSPLRDPQGPGGCSRVRGVRPAYQGFRGNLGSPDDGGVG